MSLSIEKAQKLFSRNNFADLAKDTLSKLWKYAKEGFFCDVVLIAAQDRRKINAHRAILSATNDFFETMFCSNFKEADEKEVTITEISGDILESLIEYCYTGLIDVNKDNAQLILPQASLMLFPEVVEACSAVLISAINPSNCLSMAKYAKLYNRQALIKSAEDYMKENFENVSVTDEFLQLTQKELEDYLSFDNLSVDNENEVFQALMRWINYDSANRSCALSELLPLIDLQSIKHTDLLEYGANNCHNEYLSSLLEEIKQNVFKPSKATRARTRAWQNKIIIVCKEKIQIYNPKKKVVVFNCNPPDWFTFKPILFGEKLIFIGYGEVKCFDLITKTWNELEQTVDCRARCSVELLNEYVYAVGGLSMSDGCLNTAERLDSKLNRWDEVAEMNYPRDDHCTAIVDGKLYAIGGCNDDAYLKSVECYDPITNNWNICGSLLKERENARAIVVNKEIFVFGGRKSDFEILNCIEKFNPETNTWTKVSEMSVRRHSMGVYLYNNKIYLFGGQNRYDEWLTLMEEFDPITNECKVIDSPNIEYIGNVYFIPYLSTTENRKC